MCCCTMQCPEKGYSIALQEAQQRLLALREKHKVAKSSLPFSHSEEEVSHVNFHELVTQLPDHLGWGSAVATAVLRTKRPKAVKGRASKTWLPNLNCTKRDRKDSLNAVDSNSNAKDWVKLYPDIGLGMLRQELTAPGRLWLLLRFLDDLGSGILRIDATTSQLTSKSSILHLCGKRQLRNLLRAGEGIFWQRNKTHLWLRSAAKVAFALDVERLTGRPVALPVATLLEGIGTFRAHLYAAFHSGRAKETPHGEQAMPIARDTLASLSGVGRSSQRTYETAVGLQVRANFAIGNQTTKEAQQQRAWQHGQALFEIKDFRGQQGKKGKTYLAWQLPNSYFGQHQYRPKGRQKRINRELRDLVMKGIPGNVGVVDESCQFQIEKRYFPNGKLAARAYGRQATQTLYWHNHPTRGGQAVWQCLGG